MTIDLPLFLQKFTDPINSVYLGCAISKLIMHVLLLLILAILATGSFKIISKEFVFVCVLLSTFFQSAGYVRYIGLIDPSTTYSFFYALPLIFLLLYLLPVLFKFFHGKDIKLPIILWPVWVLLLFISCLGGPINPGIALVACSVIFPFEFIKQYTSLKDIPFGKRVFLSIKNIPRTYYIYLIPIILLSLYSLFLASYNTAHIIASVLTLSERYQLMPMGILKTFLTESWLIIFGLLALNYFIIYKFYKEDKEFSVAKRILIFWLCFSAIYLILLPFGGYREWRPYVIRYDSISPITFFALFAIGYSSLFLLKRLKFKNMLLYTIPLFLVMAFFTISDKVRDYNSCEKESLAYIRDYPGDVVPLKNGCGVVSWGHFDTPEESTYCGLLIYMWKITDRHKLYYNVPPDQEAAE